MSRHGCNAGCCRPRAWTRCAGSDPYQCRLCGLCPGGGHRALSGGIQLVEPGACAGALSASVSVWVCRPSPTILSPGLILLAERPVRVGDWIVTPAGEGIVRRINVRSTEVETFDNSSIIIPNSNLITNAVRNWTLRDTMGHFSVAVAVSYDAKPDDTKAILTEIASEHPLVMRHPPVNVMLSKLSNTAMEFEVSGQGAWYWMRPSWPATSAHTRRLGKKLLFIPK
ncbi:MAG: mechanosensitive ion channel [Hyphomicrobiales bacterium]